MQDVVVEAWLLVMASVEDAGLVSTGSLIERDHVVDEDALLCKKVSEFGRIGSTSLAGTDNPPLHEAADEAFEEETVGGRKAVVVEAIETVGLWQERTAVSRAQYLPEAGMSPRVETGTVEAIETGLRNEPSTNEMLQMSTAKATKQSNLATMAKISQP